MRDITLVHPRLQVLAVKLVEECAKQGLKIKITETLRTVAEQDALYAQGRTKPGSIVTNAKGTTYSSMHQWGVAFDFCRNDGSGAYNESGKFFEKVGAIGTSLGLEWGGNWKSIIDKPHFQLPDWGSTTSKLRGQYATPEVFIKTWVPVVVNKTGWHSEDGGRRYYNGDTGQCVRNDWRAVDGRWYWFDGSGRMVTNTWYQYQDDWYYLGADGAMAKGLKDVDGKWYYLGQDGKMVTKPIELKPDSNGALHFDGLAD